MNMPLALNSIEMKSSEFLGDRSFTLNYLQRRSVTENTSHPSYPSPMQKSSGNNVSAVDMRLSEIAQIQRAGGATEQACLPMEPALIDKIEKRAAEYHMRGSLQQ